MHRGTEGPNSTLKPETILFVQWWGKRHSMLVEKGLRQARRERLVEFHSKSVNSKNDPRVHEWEKTSECKMWRGKVRDEDKCGRGTKSSHMCKRQAFRGYITSLQRIIQEHLIWILYVRMQKGKHQIKRTCLNPLGKLSVILKASEDDVTCWNFLQCFLAF